MLNAQQIMEARDLRTKVVPVPEWGGDVLLGEMGATDYAEIADWMRGLKKESQQPEDETDNSDDAITVMTCSSPRGKPEKLEDEAEAEAETEDEEVGAVRLTLSQHTELMVRYLAKCILDESTFKPAFSRDQIAELGRKDRRVLGRLYDEAMKLNLDSEQAYKDAEKNSAATAGQDSTGD